MTQWHVYVGCFTKELWNYFPRPDGDTTIPSLGIERLLFDDDTGSLRYVGVAAEGLSSPQYLDLHPTQRVLYAAEFARPGRLVALDIGADGGLSYRGGVNTIGAMAVATSIHPDGTVAYVGHLADSALTTCILDSEGGLRKVNADNSSTIPEIASSSVTQRFAYRGSGPKHHQVRVTPDGAAVIVTDVGSDAVVTYPAGGLGGALSQPLARVNFPPGAAPRHLEFHPSGNFLYVVGEGDGMLYVLEAHNHIPVRIMSCHPLAPADDSREYLPSELHLHPDGRTLFVGVRRANCIVAFDVDGSGGARTMYHESSRGQNPRAIRVSPDGRHLLVANWDSNSVSVFVVDRARRLRPQGEPVAVSSPSSFAFVAAST